MLQKIHKKLNETNKAVNQILAVKAEINGYISKLGKYPQVDKLKKESKPILDSLNTIEEHLIQTRIETNEDVLKYPVKYHTKLSALASTVATTYNHPTKQMYGVFQMLSEGVDAQVKKFNDLNKQISAFNNEVKNLDIPAVYTGPAGR